MIRIWQDQQISFGEPFDSIIQEGIDKLDEYREMIQRVPAYKIAMSECDNQSMPFSTEQLDEI